MHWKEWLDFVNLINVPSLNLAVTVSMTGLRWGQLMWWWMGSWPGKWHLCVRRWFAGSTRAGVLHASSFYYSFFWFDVQFMGVDNDRRRNASRWATKGTRLIWDMVGRNIELSRDSKNGPVSFQNDLSLFNGDYKSNGLQIWPSAKSSALCFVVCCTRQDSRSSSAPEPTQTSNLEPTLPENLTCVWNIPTKYAIQP